MIAYGDKTKRLKFPASDDLRRLNMMSTSVKQVQNDDTRYVKCPVDGLKRNLLDVRLIVLQTYMLPASLQTQHEARPVQTLPLDLNFPSVLPSTNVAHPLR